MIKLLFISIISYVTWSYFNNDHVAIAQEKIIQKESSNFVAPKIITPTFSCDGRQHCSQMSSYKEAVFFINNCPNTKMDGDHDGKPCEQQFGH